MSNRRGKPPIYKTPSVRLTVQIEASTMEALEAWREEKGMARSVSVNKLILIGLRVGLYIQQCGRINRHPIGPDGAKAGDV